MGNHNLATLMSIFVVVLMMVTSVAKAQTTATCASKLAPCATYLNSTNPPASCCNPIKETVSTDLPCLCGLYTNPAVLKSFNITIDQALNLTRACGVSTDVSKCNAPSPSGSVPGVPGAGNGAGRIAWTGFSTLFFILASMMFY